MRGLLTAFVQNTVFANIVYLIIFLGGYFAVTSLPRETFPEPNTDTVIVSIIWPGADPSEVEEGICLKIEDAIDGLEGIKRYTTISRDNVGLAFVEKTEGYDLEELKERVKNAMDRVTTFPPDSERPITEKMQLRIPVSFVALSGKDVDEKTLKEQIRIIEQELRALPELSQTKIEGDRDYEIGIEVSEDKLREYGITFEQVAKVVHANCINLPGGLMRTEGEEIRLRTIGRKYTGEEFAKIVVLARPNGDNITLDRIATIRDDFQQDVVISRFNGVPGGMISILKTSEEDILKIDEVVMRYVEQKKKELPPTVQLSVWGRFAPMLRERINLLVGNGLQGFAIVFLALWLFLDIRLSFWVSLGIPVSISGALVILWIVGGSINMISLFGLIMVLGMIVDDAIVTGDAIYVWRKNGMAAKRAAIEGVSEVGFPVLASVSTTMVAFIPLMFIRGWMGKIIAILPMVVIACLATSLLECLFCFPAHLSHLPAPGHEKEQWGPLAGAKGGLRGFFRRVGEIGRAFHGFTNGGIEWVAEHPYHNVVKLATQWRYVSVAIAVLLAMTIVGIARSGVIQFEFFPEVDGNAVKATVEFPNGTPVAITEKAVTQIENAMTRLAETARTESGKPLVENTYALVGARIDDMGRGELGTQFGTVRVELLDVGDRGIYFKDLIRMWESEIGGIPGAVSLTFTGDEIKPPGAPIEVWLQGNDLEAMKAASARVKDELGGYGGVYTIEDDFRAGKTELQLELKPEARSLGITVADLATQVYAGYFGAEAIRLQRGKDDVRVRVRFPEDERSQMHYFEQLRIRSPYGFDVPLLSVAEIVRGPGYADIKRTDGMRRVVVTAQVDSRITNTSDVVKSLQSGFFDSIRNDFPTVKVSMQGEQENLRESLSSLGVSFPLAVVGIFIIIATILRSYVQPFVILCTLPFGVTGALLGHIIFGYDFSIMSVFGAVALAGIVVNDAIVLIDCINGYLADGLPFYTAVRRGGVRRLRAVFLNSLTTMGGLLPLIFETNRQALVLIPMAIAIAIGVAFNTFMTLLLLPSLMCILNDFRRLAFRWGKGSWPTPERVEPACRKKLSLDEDPDLDKLFGEHGTEGAAP